MEISTEKSSSTSTLLTRLWERNLPILLDRLDTLDAAAAAASLGTLDTTLRAAALAHAHNLAGGLGMFGYPHGTTLAREIELLLCAPGPPPAGSLDQLTKALRTNLFPTP